MGYGTKPLPFKQNNSCLNSYFSLEAVPDVEEFTSTGMPFPDKGCFI